MDKRKTFWGAVIIAAILIVAGTGIFIGIKINQYGGPVSKILRVNLPKDAEVIEWQDDHGGFHGDGSTYGEIQLSENGSEEMLQKIKESGNWNKIKYNSANSLRGLGCKSEYTEEDKKMIPNNITNGYYYFRDRYAETYPTKKDTDIMGRAAFNYDAAVFDLDTNKVYIYVLDT